MHLVHTSSTFLLLGLAWVMALSIIFRPSWQLRPSLTQALFAGALAVEAALCIGLWEIEASPGLSTWTPMLVLAAGGAMAVGALRRGRTPAEVRSIRHWRGGIALFAVGALVANWKRLEALEYLGRTSLEQDLIANATGIAGFAALALIVVAAAPVIAVHRQRWLRRAAVPLAAALILGLPFLFAPAALAIDATCESSVGIEKAWCRRSSSGHVVESYALRSEGWYPDGGVLTSQSARLAGRVPIDEDTWYEGFAKGDGTGLRVGSALAIDGYVTPERFTTNLVNGLDDIEDCFVRAGERGAIEPGTHELMLHAEYSELTSAYVESGDADLDLCVADTRWLSNLGRSGSTDVAVELVYLGQGTEVAQR